MITLEELKEKLAECDEITLVEMVGLNSYQMVELFNDVIEEKFEQLSEYFVPEEDEEN